MGTKVSKPLRGDPCAGPVYGPRGERMAQNNSGPLDLFCSKAAAVDFAPLNSRCYVSPAAGLGNLSERAATQSQEAKLRSAQYAGPAAGYSLHP